MLTGSFNKVCIYQTCVHEEKHESEVVVGLTELNQLYLTSYTSCCMYRMQLSISGRATQSDIPNDDADAPEYPRNPARSPP